MLVGTLNLYCQLDILGNVINITPAKFTSHKSSWYPILAGLIWKSFFFHKYSPQRGFNHMTTEMTGKHANYFTVTALIHDIRF